MEYYLYRWRSKLIQYKKVISIEDGTSIMVYTDGEACLIPHKKVISVEDGTSIMVHTDGDAS